MNRFVFALLFAVVALSGCDSISKPRPLGINPSPTLGAPNGTVTLPRLGAWKDTGERIPLAKVRAEIAKHAPAAKMSTSDGVFTGVSFEYLEQSLPIIASIGEALGYQWTLNGWDCDKSSKGTSLLFEAKVGEAGIEAQALILRISVFQSVTFGNVPSGGGHSLNAIWTDRGLYVLEPQPTNRTFTLVPWADYPNRGGVFFVLVGA